MEDDRLPYIQIHDKLGIVEIRADDARSGNWLTRITYLLEILGSESWCCLNEGRTPSTRGEAALIQSCSTTRSDKRVRISPVPRSAGPFHEERCETVSAFLVSRRRFDTDQAGQHHVAEHVSADNFRIVQYLRILRLWISWFISFCLWRSRYVRSILLESMARLWYFSKFSIITDCFQCFIPYLGRWWYS